MVSSNVAVLPGDTGSPGLMEGARTGSAERRQGRAPRRASSSKGEAGALPGSTGRAASRSDPPYSSHFSSMSLQRTFLFVCFSTQCLCIRHRLFHSNKFIFSISSYGITTQIKLQSNYHIKRYPYYLTTVHIFISF